jgi:hypothetical protein
MTEWRCKKDAVLLAKIENGKVSIRYKEVSYVIEGTKQIEAVCRKCGTVNILDNGQIHVANRMKLIVIRRRTEHLHESRCLFNWSCFPAR